MHDMDRLRSTLNELGAARTPFLFGVDFEMSEGFVLSQPQRQQNVYYKVHQNTNKPSEPRPDVIWAALEIQPISLQRYAEQFDTIQRGLLRGDSFLANLTLRTPIRSALSLFDIFLLSESPYQLYIPDRFVCFSPERFVHISNGLISTCPMKGTIDAALPDAEQRILNDFKETAEHNTIVDLLRNDLSMVARDVRVTRFRYIDRIRAQDREILQVSSEITGRLERQDFAAIGDIVLRLLPAGSICGAPKSSTIRLIQAAEQEPRGFYTGIFGYFDGQTFDSAVLIRFIEQHGDTLFFRSGGGITAYSRLEDEYQETLAKIYLPYS